MKKDKNSLQTETELKYATNNVSKRWGYYSLLKTKTSFAISLLEKKLQQKYGSVGKTTHTFFKCVKN